MMTYFDDEKSLISELRGGVPHNLQDCIKPLSAGCECDARLASIFHRQLSHCIYVDVRRIAKYQVIPFARDRGKQIRLEQANPFS